MAITVVNTASCDDATNTTSHVFSGLTFAGGNRLIYVGGFHLGNITGITDSASNAWGQVRTTGANDQTWIFCTRSTEPLPITSLTVTSSTGPVTGQLFEVSGVGYTETVSDVGPSGITGTSQVYPATPANMSLPSLFIVIAYTGTSTTFSAGTFTSGGGTVQAHTTAGTAYTGYFITTDLTEQGFTFTAGTSVQSQGFIVSFLPLDPSAGRFFHSTGLSVTS